MALTEWYFELRIRRLVGIDNAVACGGAGWRVWVDLQQELGPLGTELATELAQQSLVRVKQMYRLLHSDDPRSMWYCSIDKVSGIKHGSARPKAD
jgi:hypothetical protein